MKTPSIKLFPRNIQSKLYVSFLFLILFFFSAGSMSKSFDYIDTDILALIENYETETGKSKADGVEEHVSDYYLHNYDNYALCHPAAKLLFNKHMYKWLAPIRDVYAPPPELT